MSVPETQIAMINEKGLFIRGRNIVLMNDQNLKKLTSFGKKVNLTADQQLFA